MNRRHFTTLTAFSAAGTGLPSAAEVKTTPFRVVAYNVYKCTGWPKERAAAVEFRSDRNRVADAYAEELAHYKPDVICLSESPKESLVKAIGERLDMDYRYFPSGGHWPGTVYSKHPIKKADDVPMVEGPRPKELFTRHWGRVLLTLPDGKILPFHTAHLMPADNQPIRLREIAEMVKRVKMDIVKYDRAIVAGDLNHAPGTQESKLWENANIVDTFLLKGVGEGLTIKADHPQFRIDYVMAAGSLAQKCTESRPLFERRFRLDTENEKAFCLSDHLPQLATFEL